MTISASTPAIHSYKPLIPGRGVLELVKFGKVREVKRYLVQEGSPDCDGPPGRHFRLVCQGAQKSYDVLVAELPECSTCDCEDWIYRSQHGSRQHECKHIRAMTQLVVSGLIDSEPAAEQPDEGLSAVVKLTVPCPICQTIAELVPVPDKRYTHAIRCRECEERSEADWFEDRR